MATPLSAAELFDLKKLDFEIELATFPIFLPPTKEFRLKGYKIIEELLKPKSIYLGRIPFDYKITEQLTGKKKGIYMFVLEELNSFGPNFSYLLYVGRTQKTNNFRNRFYTYRKYIGNKDSPENYRFMTNFWPGKTFIHFFELDEDDDIVQIEKAIVMSLRPPLNEDYFISKINKSESLYNIN